MMSAPTTIREDCTTGRQDLLFTRVRVFVTKNGVRRLRAKIRRNSHDFQSSAGVELWTSAGWVEVLSLDGENERMTELPSYVSKDTDANFAALTALAHELEQDALRVLA